MPLPLWLPLLCCPPEALPPDDMLFEEPVVVRLRIEPCLLPDEFDIRDDLCVRADDFVVAGRISDDAPVVTACERKPRCRSVTWRRLCLIVTLSLPPRACMLVCERVRVVVRVSDPPLDMRSVDLPVALDVLVPCPVVSAAFPRLLVACWAVPDEVWLPIWLLEPGCGPIFCARA